MKTKETNLSAYMLRGMTLLYLIAMTGIFPFFFQNSYFDIVSAKKDFFQGATVILLVCAVVFGVPSLWQVRGKWRISREVSAMDVWVIVFMIAVAISSMLSPCGSEAFWGNEGRQLGGVFLFLCGGAYFVVSRCYRTSGTLLWIFLLVNCGGWLLVACNFWGLDVFQMQENLPAQYLTYFIGTMGNVNINAEYCGIITVLMMGFFYRCNERLSRIWFWGASVLGIYACFCTRSDSWMLAVGGGMLVLLGFALTEAGLSKWREILAAFFCGAVGMKITEVLDQLLGWENIYIQDFREQGRLMKVLDVRVLMALAGMLTLGYVLEKSSRVRESRFLKFLQEQGIWLLLGVSAAGVLAAAVLVFPLEDSFGSNRGYIWKRTIWNFRELPVHQKIFGYGPNCFLSFMEEAYGAEMRMQFVSPFADAHNEFLQFLAVTGILGAISYMGIQISAFVSCLGKRKQEPILLLGCAGIFAYMLQALVNNPSVFTTPLYFIFLGIIQCKIRKKSE